MHGVCGKCHHVASQLDIKVYIEFAMSLINQMLHDLEQRKPPNGQVQPPDALPWAVPLKTGQSKRHVYYVLMIVLLCALIFAGFKLVWPLLSKTTVELKSAHAVSSESLIGRDMVTSHSEHTASMVFKPIQAQTLVSLGLATQSSMNLSFQPSLDKTLHISLANGLIHHKSSSKQLIPIPKSINQPISSEASSNTVSEVVENSDVLLSSGAIPMQLAGKSPTLKPIEKPIFNKVTTPAQQALNDYHQAVSLIQQGRVKEAQDQLMNALTTSPNNDDIRQVLVGLLVENKHRTEAMQLLKDGLLLNPQQIGFAIMLARLQLDAGQSVEAMSTLEKSLPYAKQDAAFHGFYAMLLQRTEQHALAVKHYQTAINLDGDDVKWLVGLAVSLQAEGKSQEAMSAYQKAQSYGLEGELSSFVSLKLKQLNQVLAQHATLQ